MTTGRNHLQRILIVEPDGLLRWSVQTYFARWYEVVAVASPADAEAKLVDAGVHALVASEDMAQDAMLRVECTARRHDPATVIVYMGTRLSSQGAPRSGTQYVEKPHVLSKLADLLGVDTGPAAYDVRESGMFTSDYMTPDPVTVRVETSLAQAWTLLEEHHFHHLPVLDSTGRVAGIITDRDVRCAVGLQKTPGDKPTVSEVMTADPVTISAKMPLDEALAVFCSNRFGALPVIRDETLVGVITKYDMLRAFYDVLGLDRAGCRVEVALPDIRADLAHTFEALRDCPQEMISAVVSRTRRDGGEPALYLRVAGTDASVVRRHLREKSLAVIEPNQA